MAIQRGSSSAVALAALRVFTRSSISSSTLDNSIISYGESHPDKHNSDEHNFDEHAMAMFESWLVEHGKKYNALDEKERRFQIFKDNLRLIEEHNSKESCYKLGLNNFADLTDKEFRSNYLGHLGAKTDLKKQEQPTGSEGFKAHPGKRSSA